MLLQYGTGSYSGHSVTAIWDKKDGELYICESQDGGYWPLATGIQRTPYEKWMEYAVKADYNVAHIPLRKDLADKYDEEKVWEFFKEVQGMPFGFRNMIFSWVDTENENFPDILDLDFLYISLTILEGIDKKLGSLMQGEALNKRLGTTDLDLKSIVVEAHKQNKTIHSLFAEVEKEGQMYSDGIQYVCSCFVIATQKRAGIFGDLELNATEFTSKDVYELKIFDETSPLDDSCKKNDPSLRYCQVMGTYLMEQPKYNSIEPYSHMNEHCPSVAPDFVRKTGC